MALLAAVAALPAAAGAAPKGGSTNCNPRKQACTASDTTAPTVAIGSPAAGSTVAGVVTVTGSASDNVALGKVEVRVDSGAWVVASGTSTWSSPVDTAALADGPHTITARATDSSANAASAAVSVSVSNGAIASSTPPTVTIASPASGSTVSGTVTVSGTAADDVAVADVTVSVDGGPWLLASGTTSWSAAVDTSTLAAGDHTITARARDTSGQAATKAVPVSVASASSSGDVIVTDPNATYGLELLGRTRLPTWGAVTGVLASESFTQRKVAWFRDAATGATSVVTLPTDSNQGWYELASVMTSPTDLWLMGGTGPLTFRHYRLSGSPLPTSAALLESRTFGDPDSRQGDLLGLASGAVVAAWHQQGANGLPQGQYVAYRRADGSWQQLPQLSFMETRGSDQVLGQHPADGSVWLFSSPDSWAAIGVVHLTESSGGLAADWTNGFFIRDEIYGQYGPDPEDPFLAVAADPWTGTLALAYQSADRRYFGDQALAGSRVAVARISAQGTMNFIAAPVWAERVAAIGLVVRPGETVVSYRPVDEATLTYDDVEVSRHRAGAWETPVAVGTVARGTRTIAYGTSRPEFVTILADSRIHLRTV